MTNRAIFECQSTIEVPTKVLSLTLDSSSDDSSSLGIQLANHDNGLTNEMFIPGYASVGKSHTY
jgi:Tfp pilus assembly protein PilZ